MVLSFAEIWRFYQAFCAKLRSLVDLVLARALFFRREVLQEINFEAFVAQVGV
jgi:hypothetical protein